MIAEITLDADAAGADAVAVAEEAVSEPVEAVAEAADAKSGAEAAETPAEPEMIEVWRPGRPPERRAVSVMAAMLRVVASRAVRVPGRVSVAKAARRLNALAIAVSRSAPVRAVARAAASVPKGRASVVPARRVMRVVARRATSAMSVPPIRIAAAKTSRRTRTAPSPRLPLSRRAWIRRKRGTERWTHLPNGRGWTAGSGMHGWCAPVRAPPH